MLKRNHGLSMEVHVEWFEGRLSTEIKLRFEKPSVLNQMGSKYENFLL